jgi:hypothetical protein
MIRNIETFKDGYFEEGEEENRCRMCGTSTDELYPAKIQYKDMPGSAKDILLCRMCVETLSEFAE